MKKVWKLIVCTSLILFKVLNSLIKIKALYVLKILPGSELLREEMVAKNLRKK